MKNKTKFDPYWMPNQKSIYEGLRTFAQSLYPPKNKWQATSDNTCNILLNSIMGTPIGSNRYLIIFQKTHLCNILGKHLLGISLVSEKEALEMRDKMNDYYNMSRKQLPAPRN